MRTGHTPFRIRSLAKFLSAVVLSGVAGGLFSSCDTKTTGPGPSDVVFPDSGVSYSRNVETLFQESCVSGSCHGGSSPAAGLNLERPSYHNLIDHVPNLVDALQPDRSLLVLSISGTSIGRRMPLGLSPLTDNQIRGIRRWMLEGAQNN